MFVLHPGFTRLLHNYYDFSSSVSFFQIPYSLGDLTQPVPPVDHRCYLPAGNELADHGQILFIWFCYEKGHLLPTKNGKLTCLTHSAERSINPGLCGGST